MKRMNLTKWWSAPEEAESILLVEDDADLQTYLADVLRGLDYRVIAAPSAEAAREVLRSARSAVRSGDCLPLRIALTISAKRTASPSRSPSRARQTRPLMDGSCSGAMPRAWTKVGRKEEATPNEEYKSIQRYRKSAPGIGNNGHGACGLCAATHCLRQGPAVISLRRVQRLFSARRASRCHRLEAARIRQSPARQATG